MQLSYIFKVSKLQVVKKDQPFGFLLSKPCTLFPNPQLFYDKNLWLALRLLGKGPCSMVDSGGETNRLIGNVACCSDITFPYAFETISGY